MADPAIPRELLKRHVQGVQAAVSCISREVVLTDGRNVWLSRNPARLTTFDTPAYPSTDPIWLTVQQELESTTGTHPIRLRRYNYRLVRGDQEIVAYHRHGGLHGYDHLHTAGPLAGLALPTNEVGLDLVVWACVNELLVRPQRDDWSIVLLDSMLP